MKDSGVQGHRDELYWYTCSCVEDMVSCIFSILVCFFYVVVTIDHFMSRPFTRI